MSWLHYFGFGVLLLAVFVSAFMLINIKHWNRVAFIEIQALQAEQNELRMEWKRLQLGFNSFGNIGRVEEIADRQLNMYVPSNQEMVNIVIYD